MKSLVWLVLLLPWLAWPAPATAADGASEWLQGLLLSGRLDAIRSVRVRAPHDGLTSRARLRLSLEAHRDAVYGYLSADAEKNWKIDTETGIDLHEGWLEYAAGGWDLRIGRQIVIWGQADGVQVTDIISPPDYTESVTRELDEIRLPVDAAKLRLLGGRVDTEWIWIPFFKAAVQPSGDNPWAVQQTWPDNTRVSVAAPVEPGASLKDGELAMRVSAYFSGLDVAASVFYTWDDYPAMHRRVWTDGQTRHVAYAPRHHRMTVFGLSFSRPWSDFVFRGEAAYYKGRYREVAAIADDPVQKDSLKWLGGIDWTPGNDWTVTVQLTGDTIINYDRRLADDAHAPMSTFSVSKKCFNQLLTLTNMLYYSIREKELYDRITAQYALTDALHLYLGADIFSGGGGRFGVYQDNSQVWLKANYRF